LTPRPPLIINGPQDFLRFAWAMHIADLIIAWWLWRQSPRRRHSGMSPRFERVAVVSGA
jgi:hypothetical protein